MVRPKTVVIDVGAGRVSGLLLVPKGAQACYVFAHGAGAGMAHPFMTAVAEGLGERGIATLRYQFPYMEHGGKRPDSPKVAREAVRAAVACARGLCPDLPLFAGGKSFGGRMTSQAEAARALGVSGLVFLGFPLHAAGTPSRDRAAHLSDVAVPMLFVQGTRDALADTALMADAVKTLGRRATLLTVDGGDHSFHVPARSGRSDDQVRARFLDDVARWVGEIAARR
jgi:uncharacterized protein